MKVLPCWRVREKPHRTIVTIVSLWIEVLSQDLLLMSKGAGFPVVYAFQKFVEAM
jgi:hypothetical protein